MLTGRGIKSVFGSYCLVKSGKRVAQWCDHAGRTHRRNHARAASYEQRIANQIAQPPECLADRRLRMSQTYCGSGYAAGFQKDQKCMQLSKIELEEPLSTGLPPIVHSGSPSMSSRRINVIDQVGKDNRKGI